MSEVDAIDDELTSRRNHDRLHVSLAGDAGWWSGTPSGVATDRAAIHFPQTMGSRTQSGALCCDHHTQLGCCVVCAWTSRLRWNGELRDDVRSAVARAGRNHGCSQVQVRPIHLRIKEGSKAEARQDDGRGQEPVRSHSASYAPGTRVDRQPRDLVAPNISWVAKIS